MPVNDNKPKNPEDIINDVINTFIGAFGAPPSEGKPATPTVDPIAEANRLLKKAETAASGGVNEADILLAIADRHIRIIDTALAHQR